jgi:3-methyladenine DNA glycosylase AlkC
MSGLDAEVEAITKMGLSDFETYIEILVALRGAFHRKYIIESLDATMLKNKAGALLAQTRARNAPRRFALDSRLLEVCCRLRCCARAATRLLHRGDADRRSVGLLARALRAVHRSTAAG